MLIRIVQSEPRAPVLKQITAGGTGENTARYEKSEEKFDNPTAEAGTEGSRKDQSLEENPRDPRRKGRLETNESFFQSDLPWEKSRLENT